MKKVILIHGFNGVPKMYEWVRDELEKSDILVVIPKFPPREGVEYASWASVMNDYQIDTDSIVVCHSIGNEFLIKYLYEKQLGLNTYIGLAGFSEAFYNEGKDELNRAVQEFLATEEEMGYFTRHSKKRFAIYSDNDHIIPFSVLEKYPQDIDAEGILIPGIGHMGSKSGLTEFPELLKIIRENYDIITDKN